jgi:ABC-2 type transport system ATP-binding protein
LATCRRSAASIREWRSASSSSTSAAYGLDARTARAAAARWLKRLGLAGRADDKVEELSHGNQQRAQLAAALLHEPELLVLDEPFAGLDPVAVHTLAEVLRGEAARGAAVLFSSHQLELVEDICEEVAIVDHGRIVATGALDALRQASQRRWFELQLEGASPSWLPDVAGVELVARRNGKLRLLASCDVDPKLVLAEAERAGRVVGFTYGPPSLAELFLELVTP